MKGDEVISIKKEKKKRGTRKKRNKKLLTPFKPIQNPIYKEHIFFGILIKRTYGKILSNHFSYNLSASFSFLFTRNLSCSCPFCNMCCMIFSVFISGASEIHYSTFSGTFLFSRANSFTFAIVPFYKAIKKLT